MAVKESSSDDRASAATGATIDGDMSELLRLMPRVFRGMRSPGDGEPPAAGGPIARGLAELKAILAAAPLGPRHIPVIVVLELEGPMAVSELARRLGLSVPSVSLMTSELERVGLVQRREDEVDRRRTLVSIAPQHHAKLEPFVRARIAPLRRALERMEPEVRKAFVEGWRVLAAELDASHAADEG